MTTNNTVIQSLCILRLHSALWNLDENVVSPPEPHSPVLLLMSKDCETSRLFSRSEKFRKCCDFLSCWTSARCTKRTPIIFLGDQLPMPRKQCLRRDDCRDLRHQLSTNLLRLCCQPAALIVTEPKAPVANLFSQNSVFFHQEVDDMPLMLVHPTSQTSNEE